MSLRRFSFLISCILLLSFGQVIAQAPPAAAPAPASQPAPPPPPPVKVLLLVQSKGFEHEVAKRKDGKPCVVEQVFGQMGEKSKLFTVEAIGDAALITPEKLKDVQIVVFYTTLDLPVKPELLEEWIKGGGSFMGIHCATDTFHGNPTYLGIINGEFEAHPWDQETVVTIKVNDASHPATKGFPEHHTIKEEIYQQKGFDPKAVHLLLSLDMQRTAMKRPQHIPIAWCKEYGKGKVFYTSLGHREDVWTSEVYQNHVVGAIRWLRGLDKADVTPNPKVSEEEDKIAKEAAAGPAADTLPKVPDGFTIKTFVRAPEIISPASIAVTPDGKVFVGEDDYNTGLGIEEGICRVKLCVDTDRDGKSDKVTVFADKLNAPQGMTYVGGTLYVVHAPLLTALRDTNGDGVADERVDLVTGLGPKPEGLVHHIPSGVRMGIDGWLYIAVGDKGIKEATGKDGRKVSIHGGGVVRVRPDGTEIELFASGLRNIYAVSVDPYMNVFTRDNTNDGGGWNARLSLIQRGAEYGYPSLFKNFADEIVPAMEDFGGGGATGSMYVQEPGWPGTYGDSLYTQDWARGITYRHELKARGATFGAPQEEFVKPVSPTGLDMDGQGKMYLADWHRKSWGKTEPEGIIFCVTGGAGLASFPDMGKASVKQLLDHLASPSQVRRREAQWELMKRGPGPEVMSGLKEIAESRSPMYARVAAVFTMMQLDASVARDTVRAMAQEPEMREVAIRALADRDSYLAGVEPTFFTGLLSDASPRVRAQAAIALGHVNKPEAAKPLVALTADEDVMVRHAAMRSIRRLNNPDPCIAVLSPWQKPEVVAGALRTLRRMHEEKVVNAVGKYLANESQPKMRQEAIRALTPLYKQDAPWDGSWWLTRPDTDGPYFKAAPWAQTPAVAELMVKAMSDPDPATAQLALAQIGLCKVEEAVPALAKLAGNEGPMRIDAAKSLVAMKSATPAALTSMEAMVLTEAFDADLRGSAAASLGATDGPEARKVLVHLLATLDANPKVTDALLDKCADALASKPAAAEEVTTIVPLLQKGSHRSTRIAAATTLLRSDAPPAKEAVAKIWKDNDTDQLDVTLTAAAKVPAEATKAQVEPIRALLKDKREPIRHAAITAVGRIRDEAAIDDLLASFNQPADRITAASALTHISPGKVNDKQILIVAKALVQACVATVKGPERDAYGRLMNAAEKFLADPRVPKEEVASLQSQLRQPGIIDKYQRTEPIPAPDGQAFTVVFPPENTPGGPFAPFPVKEKTYAWQPLVVTDPRGAQKLEMTNNSVLYLTASYESAVAGPALLTMGSDDGVKVWHNGKSVHTFKDDRALKADLDKVALTLTTGPNVLLFRVNNTSNGSGIQARIRSRVPEFDTDELPDLVAKFPGKAERGKAIFTSNAVNCTKCHAIDPKEEPKGPFLGDAGSKFDIKHLTESITRPASKIAQGFATEKIVAKDAAGAGESEYVGFIVKEGAEDVQLRDANGKVMTIAKHHITRRVTLAGSIMPDGLVDTMPLDDFGSLVTYLQSLKGAGATTAPATTAAAAAK